VPRIAKKIMSEKIIFTMSKLTKVSHQTKKVLLKNINLSFYYGAKIGILGSNGAGKSTCMKIIAGLDDDYDGSILKSPDITFGYLPQNPQLDDHKTVGELVGEAFGKVFTSLNRYEEIAKLFENPLDEEQMQNLFQEQMDLQEYLDNQDAWDLESHINVAMRALNCPPKNAFFKDLSGGEKRRVALCQLLLKQPDVLLLDEPTNHLDAETIYWLEQHLKRYEGTVIAVTHDRYFLDHVAEWILELDRGEGIPWKGNYSSWLDQKQKRLFIEEKRETERQKALKKELEWIQSSPKARQSKGKARLLNYDKLLEQQKTQVKDVNALFIPAGPRLGEKVLEVSNISKSFGTKNLFSNLSFSLPRSAIVGIIGPNGMGKTTLFKILSQKMQPDSGTISWGESVKLGYADQERSLDETKNIFEIMNGGYDTVEIHGQLIPIRPYLAKFYFSGEDQSKKIGVLSGGERNRLHLAKTFLEAPNVLFLDEPTNDLDVHSLRSLEEALENFSGCAVVISHDRYFLDRVATHILAFEGDQHPYFFVGNHDDYLEDLKRRKGNDHFLNTQLKYKKLTR
jgi:ATP-binding cassette ChvD family protein